MNFSLSANFTEKIPQSACGCQLLWERSQFSLLFRGDSPRGGEMSPQVTKGTAQYEMPDRVEESFASLEKGGGTQCRRDIPLSLRDIPAQGTPFGRLFKGDYLKNWFVCLKKTYRRGKHGSPGTPPSSLRLATSSMRGGFAKLSPL